MEVVPRLMEDVPQENFLMKIPNTTVLREFLVNKGGYYLQPIEKLTNKYLKKVLNGKKKAFKVFSTSFLFLINTYRSAKLDSFIMCLDGLSFQPQRFGIRLKWMNNFPLISLIIRSRNYLIGIL